MGGDMISRSDIMERLKRLELNQIKGEVIKGINAAAFVVETAPDAEPEDDNTSTFELYEDKDFSGGGYLLCTQCKYKFSFGAYHILEYDNFCPHCGRKIIRQADPNTIELTFTRQEGGEAE